MILCAQNIIIMLDMWSIGIMLFHALTGQPLYDRILCGDDNDEMGNGYWAAMNGKVLEYINMNGFQSTIPHKIASLIAGLVNPEEEERLSSMQAMQHDWFTCYYQQYKQRHKYKNANYKFMD